ncbi:MAG: hypothetical protein ACOYL3_19410 [Desulfuromonadaceae bacterium]
MALSSDQRNVFMLAMEKIETYNIRAMDHAGRDHGSSRKRFDMAPVAEWALDYMACLPDDSELSRLIIKAHMGSDEKWSQTEIRKCGGACRGFYQRVQKKRLFSAGIKYIG